MSSQSPLTRRDILRTAALTFSALASASALSACTDGYDTEPDPLRPLLEQARSDTVAANHLADSGAEQADLARQVARVRSEQAEALQAEVERANRPVPEPAATAPDRPADHPAVDFGTLARRLTDARQQAGELVPRLPRHRAGLAGSVVAGCAALQQLAPALGGEQPDEFEPGSAGQLSAESVHALQEALAAEHAAIWVYDLVRAFLPADFDRGIDAGAAEHRHRRDVCARLLTAADVVPRPAEPAYPPPHPVTGADSAKALVITAETDVAAMWHAVLERTDDATLRTWGTHALAGSAARGTKWRIEAGQQPAAIALPGRQKATHS